MNRIAHSPLAGFATICMVLMQGCSRADGPTRYEVHGTVTYGGKPVPNGFITFEPDAAAGNQGPAGGAEINDGAYRTLPGRGVVGGPHVVRIEGTDGIPIEIPGEGMNNLGTPMFPEYVTHADLAAQPSEYNVNIPVSVK